MVTYPNRPGKDRPNYGGANRPNVGNIGNTNIGNIGNTNIGNIGNTNIGNINRPSVGNINNVHIDKVNVGRQNLGLNRPATLPAANRNWDNNRWGGNRGVWGNNNNINVNVNNNFYQNNNFSYRPNYWGARPWWGASTCYPWHYGHWNYGWNSHYYHSHWYYNDNNFASGFMWGIAVWSLGNMIYDMGYHSYRNPYPAPPVQNTTIVYTQPLSVSAAANPPGNEQQTQIAETKSADAVERSRTAFKKGDYVTAATAVDEALGYTPGDVTLHEYRALIMFALGKYADSTGVLNAVLASGPGWGWDTMIAFYGDSATYSSQLRKLEAYVKGKPDSAEGRFLLGYHYMVCGFMDKAYEQFERTTKLQPADSIARQLRDLTKSSLPDAGGETPPPSEQPTPIPSEKLVGTWVSDRGQEGKITFKMEKDGNYSWSYTVEGKTTDLKGTYGLDDKGLLVLSSDGSQMISSVTLESESTMKFVLIGAPDGDPGLSFTKG
jgi:tetratricopeptide (TPR) repeat protein